MDMRVLRLNEGQGEHSIWHPTELDFMVRGSSSWLRLSSIPAL